MPTIYTLSRPGRILQEVTGLYIVPTTRPDGDPDYVIAFEVHEYVNHRTGRITDSPESRVVVVETHDDLGSPRVISESDWVVDGQLIAAVPVEQADGTERRIRCVLLESEQRLDLPTDADELKAFQAEAENFVRSLFGLGPRPAPPEILRTSIGYVLRDPLSGDSHEFLSDSWPGKIAGAHYRPIGAGGKVIDGEHFVVLADRSTSPTVDQFIYALVALRVATSSLRVTAELQLDTLTTGAAGSPFASAKITPVSDGPNDGWVVVQASNGELRGYNISHDVSTFLGPSTILAPPDPDLDVRSRRPYFPPGVDPETVRVAGGLVAARRSGGGSVTRRGSYMAVFTSPPTLGRLLTSPLGRPPSTAAAGGGTAVVGFDWSTDRSSTLLPSLTFRNSPQRHGPSSGPSAVAVDTRTDCHWYLADWGSVAEPLSIEARPDSDSVVVSSPPGSPSRFGSARLRFSRIGHVGSAYWRTHTFDPPTLIPHASCVALAFDHRRDAVLLGFQSMTGDENRVVVELAQNRYYSVVSFEADGCPAILPLRSNPRDLRTFPIAGSRYFTLSLQNGPPNQRVTLWIGMPFRVRTSGPCDLFVRTDDPSTRRFRTTTDETGTASVSVQVSEANLPGVFDVDSTTYQNFGAILEYPHLLVAQWSWWDYDVLPERAIGGFGDPESGSRLDIVTGNSSPLFLVVSSGFG